MERDTLRQLLRDMLLSRVLEERAAEEYGKGNIVGFLHLYPGEEAVGAGVINAAGPADYIVSTYREHAHAVVRGTPARNVMAELFGRADGMSGGMGGSMHMFDAKRRFMGGYAIVGESCPIALGVAYAVAMRRGPDAVVCFLGDGAVNQGTFHESLNMAGLYDLPCIYIVENNEFAMGTRLEYHAADPELWKRGIPFNIKSERIDGMDALQMLKDAQRIVDEVRETGRPYFVEVMTYRYSGHGAADNDRQLYRTKEEEEEARKRDPIKRLEKVMADRNIMTEEKMEAIDAEIQEEVEKVYQAADASPFPDPDDVYENVYSDMPPEKGH